MLQPVVTVTARTVHTEIELKTAGSFLLRTAKQIQHQNDVIAQVSQQCAADRIRKPTGHFVCLVTAIMPGTKP